MALARIDVTEQNKVTQEHTPVWAKAMNQMRPIDSLCAALKNVRNICAVEPFAFHNVRLHPYHLLRRTKFHVQAKQFVIVRPLEPRIIHLAQTVAGTKNQIDVVPAVPCFSKPMGECLLRRVSGAGEGIDGCIDVMRPNIEIEIF